MKKLSMDELNRCSVEEYKALPKRPVYLALDNVRSMHNVGAAFRTADAFLIQELVLIGITAQPPHREIQKTALGATESVDWRHFATVEETLAYFRSLNCLIVAVEQTDDGVELPDFVPPTDRPVALILGNEISGVSDEIIEGCDLAVEIPQFGAKHSLNLSVAGGIVLYEVCSKMRLK